MSFFVSFPHAFAKVATALDSGEKAYNAALAQLVENCIFPSAEAAGEAFNAAKAEAAAALLATQRAEALKAGEKALAGVTLTKALNAKLLDVLQAATVLDPETGEPNAVSVVYTLDGESDEPTLVCKLVGSQPRAVRAGNGSGRGKALLNGEKLTAALLNSKYPNSFAARALKNPHEADPQRWGAKTRLNATQAVKADPELSKLLTFES